MTNGQKLPEMFSVIADAFPVLFNNTEIVETNKLISRRKNNGNFNSYNSKKW